MRKKVLILFSLICCIVMVLGVFVACNDDTGTGGNGAGDSIFTEGASLDDIITALENAESLTYTLEYNYEGTDDSGAYYSEYVEQYKIASNTQFVTATQILRTNGSEEMYAVNEYTWLANGIYYSVRTESENYNETTVEETTVEKNLAPVKPLLAYIDNMVAVWADTIERYLATDEEGNIVFNPNAIYVSDRYVVDNAYVRFNGNSLEIGYDYSYLYTNMVMSEKHIISGVNATTADIPDEVKALEVEAEWSNYVDYNEVRYTKMTDTDGSEYYVVTYNPDGAVIEETINTLPVRR